MRSDGKNRQARARYRPGGGGAGGRPRQSLVLKANRHGLIGGATGTGVSATVQGLAEGFSAVGVPYSSPM